MQSVQIKAIGNSSGIILPKTILEQLHSERGDQLYITKTPDGIAITPYDAEFEEQMEVAKQIMREDKNVLRKLAQ